MRVKDIANRLDVSPATIRNWSSQFADHLSPGASPPKGQTRAYSNSDLETLAAIAHYKNVQRLTYEQIGDKLQAGDHETEGIPIPEPPPSETTETAMIPMTLVQALLSELRADKATLQERLEGAQVELQEAQREIGRLEGRLQELQSKQAKTWLDRLLGR